MDVHFVQYLEGIKLLERGQICFIISALYLI